MLTSTEILDRYYLEARRDLLEIAALLDRYDVAVEREESFSGEEAKLSILRRALTLLSDPDSPRGERTTVLLELFAEI
ncbi:MAG: hypothetical protein AAGC68_01445 [Verrucomicrobiota bacterium]